MTAEWICPRSLPNVLYFMRRSVSCGHERRHRTGSRKQSLVYSQVLERGSLNALKGRGDTPDFGQVAEDRSEGESRQEPLLGSAGEARQRRAGSVGFAS